MLNVKLGIFTHHGSQATAKKCTHDTHACFAFFPTLVAVSIVIAYVC